MGKVGRYFCVAIPFILTVLSIIFLIVAALAGISNKGLFMFEINLSDLSIDTNTISSLIGGRDIGDDISNALSGNAGGSEKDGEKEGESAGDKAGNFIDKIGNAFDSRDLGDTISDAFTGKGGDKEDSGDSEKGGESAGDKVGSAIDKIGNAFGARDEITDKIGDIAGDALGGGSSGGGSSITPSDLGLHDVYKVSVWSYCKEKKGGKDSECTKPKMRWADQALDTSFIEDITNALGSDFQIPKEIESALNTFKTVSFWTQVVFIIALAALAAQIIVGFFSACSRVASCICFLVAGLSTVATIAAAALSTATSAVIVGALEGSEQMYGAKGTINKGFLALVWIAVSFAIGAAVFWLATICCCSPDRSSRRERRKAKHLDSEKGFAGASPSYEPLQDPNDPYGGHGHGHNGGNAGYYGGSQTSHNAPSFYEQPYNSQYGDHGHGRADMAYEPYSHRA